MSATYHLVIGQRGETYIQRRTRTRKTYTDEYVELDIDLAAAFGHAALLDRPIVRDIYSSRQHPDFLLGDEDGLAAYYKQANPHSRYDRESRARFKTILGTTTL